MDLHQPIRPAHGAAVIALVLVCIAAGFWYMRGTLPAPGPQGSAVSQDPRTQGIVKSVGKGTLTVAVLHYDASGAASEGAQMAFAADAGTRISMQVLRPRAEFEKELAAYQAGTGKETLPYTLKTLELSELTAGSEVTITPAEADSNRAVDIQVIKLAL